MLIAFVAATLLAMPAAAGDAIHVDDDVDVVDGEAVVVVREVRLAGNTTTRDDTLLDLLPRRPPARFRRREIAELERRINNLGVFDAVSVALERDVLVVSVREKFTLTPSLAFSTGQRLADVEGEIGVTEYNFLGSASQLGVVVGRAQRGPTAWVWFEEHALRPTRGSLAVAAGLERASFRFGGDPDRPSTAWSRDRAGVEAAWRTPYLYGALPLRYEVGALVTREIVTMDAGDGVVVPDGWETASVMMLTYDRYTWRDLVPSGLRMKARVAQGFFFPEKKPRTGWSLSALAAAPLGPLTVLATQLEYEGVTHGNANHSVLVGSQDGVRGLRDAFYRNQQQVNANVELRHAIKLADRWAVQGVVFSDASVFLPMDARGKPLAIRHAISAGGGVRLVPTFLTQLLLRVDVARLFAPEERWFVQLGVTQYF